MGVRFGVAVIGLLLLAGQAVAGPWPRGPGSVFSSLAVERDANGNSYTSLYTEYGRPERRVWGLELGRTNLGETSFLVWSQRSLDSGQGANRLSYSLGGGVVQRDGELLPMGQAALFWGRGFQGLMQGGWISAEARLKQTSEPKVERYRDGMTIVEYSYLTQRTTAKLDLTFGLNATDRTMAISQLRLERQQGSDLSARLALSLVHEVAGPLKVELGYIANLVGPGEDAVRLGTWVDF